MPDTKGIVGYSFHGGDLLHIGHLHQLLECRKHCDYLVVGLLTDQAIASYKRLPIIPYPWREAIYKQLRCVDKVMPQDSRDPTDNLKNLEPDILFHGDDWPEIPGSEWMFANGGKVIVTPYFHGISTSSIIERCVNYDN
jgi:phosphoenolpyruvate phosphomutase